MDSIIVTYLNDVYNSGSGSGNTSDDTNQRGVARSPGGTGLGTGGISGTTAASSSHPDVAAARLLGKTSGNGAPRNTLLSVCSFIIANEFCERMAYYGFASSLVLFFTRRLGWSSGDADIQVAVWSGVCYLSPLLGGWLADTYLGRYNAIMLFIGIYLVGLVMVTITAQDGLTNVPLFFIALYTVALGTGGIKPNVSTFGADQFSNTAADKAQKETFFNWFYFSINLGALFSYTVVAYLCQNVSFGIGYSIPLAAMAIAILVFWLGRHRYKRLPPGGSVLSTFCGIIWQAAWTNRNSPHQVNHWLERASINKGGTYGDDKVADARAVCRLVPYLLFLIIYWGIYAQMTTTFFNQGCQMDLYIGSFVVPVSALNLFNTVIILVLIPICDRVIYPCIKRCGWNFTMLKKIGVGFLLAALSMVVAAIVETRRLKLATEGKFVGLSICVDVNQPEMVDLSVFWQIPQFLLIGASEVFASITALEFFYTQAPESMRSVCAALNLVTSAFGQWLVAILIPIVNSGSSPWVAHDANLGHLDWFFWLLAGLMMADLFLFMWSSRDYEYKEEEPVGELPCPPPDVIPVSTTPTAAEMAATKAKGFRGHIATTVSSDDTVTRDATMSSGGNDGGNNDIQMASLPYYGVSVHDDDAARDHISSEDQQLASSIAPSSAVPPSSSSASSSSGVTLPTITLNVPEESSSRSRASSMTAPQVTIHRDRDAALPSSV